MKTFGTLDRPLRCSKLPLLATCTLRAFLLESLDGGSSTAADTGSAVHAAVHAWHNSKDYKKAIAAMHAGIQGYPQADFRDAELSFRPYTEDERNINATVVLAEEKVAFTLPPAEFDSTKEPIALIGTLDQLRREADGTLRLYDLKCGKKYDGYTMMHTYALQIAAYCYGATQKLGETVQPGAIIASYDYRRRTRGNVFYEFAWDLNHARNLLRSVQRAVALIRMGHADATPGEHCTYCPIGLDNCLRVEKQSCTA